MVSCSNISAAANNPFRKVSLMHFNAPHIDFLSGFLKSGLQSSPSDTLIINQGAGCIAITNMYRIFFINAFTKYPFENLITFLN